MAVADDETVLDDNESFASSVTSSSFVDDESSADDISNDPVMLRNLNNFPPLLPSVPSAGRMWNRDQTDSVTQAVLREKLRQIESDINLSEEDSASLSGASDRDTSNAKLPGLWSKLQETRQGIRVLRKEMSAKRKAIQELRKRKDDAENRFMGLVRPHLVIETGRHAHPLPVEMLLEHFNALQTIRDECSTAEWKYEAMENQMDHEEKDLMILETEFFSLLYGKSVDSEHDDSSGKSEDDRYVPPSRTSLLGISGDRPVDIHPLYRHLLNAVGDRVLAQEELADLLATRDAVLGNIETRLKLEWSHDDSTLSEDDLGSLKSTLSGLQDADELVAKFGSAMQEDELEFLVEFEVEEKNAQDILRKATAEVDHTRTLCIETGVVPKNAPYYEEYTIFADTESMQFETITIGNDTKAHTDSLANPCFPILLSNPKHVLGDEPLTAKSALREATKLPKDDPKRPQLVADSIKEYSITNLVAGATEKDKSDFINRWLLQRLRITPMEVELLFCVFSKFLKVVNRRRWQEDVLYFWSRDDANTPPDKFEGPVTTMTTMAHVISEALALARPGSDGRPEDLRKYNPTTAPRPRPTTSDPGNLPYARNSLV